jgi:hypothetical protein
VSKLVCGVAFGADSIIATLAIRFPAHQHLSTPARADEPRGRDRAPFEFGIANPTPPP